MTRCTPRPASAFRYAGSVDDERLALAGLHLGDPAEVQRGAAHDLDVEVALAEHPPAGLAHDRERLGQQVVEHVGDEVLLVLGFLAVGAGVVDPLLELGRLGRELLVGEALDLGLERVDLGHDRLDRFEAAALAGVENLVEQSHAAGESTGGPAGPRAAPGRSANRPGQGASTSFSRTAYIAASTRERTCSFSRMLRTWLRTVFSAITSSAPMSLFDIPAR